MDKDTGQYVLTQDTDGKYHWSYELNLFTNPTVLITVFKVFGGIVLCMGIWIGLLNGEPFVKTLVYIGQFWLYGLGFILVLISLGYLLYATVQGGKYCVVFEMDEKTVTHTQVAKQFRKAQVLAALAAFVGAVKGSLSMVGTGLSAGSRRSMKTVFKKVSAIKVKRRLHVIYLRSGIENNQIYAQPEQFDAVLEHILSHIPESAKRLGDLKRNKHR